MKTLILGTRGSQLATTQSRWVAERVQAAHAAVTVQLKIIQTTGDRDQSTPLPAVGGKGLFTAELDRGVLSGDIHFAVHSMKDLPTDLAPGLGIAAVPQREDPRDALISRGGARFADLPKGARVGTGSLRRMAQLRHVRPDLTFLDIRGNVDTRLRKLEQGDYDAVVLAAAGLRRLGLAERITEYFDADVLLSAVGQGALAVTCKVDDEDTEALLAAISDPATATAVAAERALLAALGGGCHVPIAALGRVDPERLELDALVAAPDGRRVLRRSHSGTVAAAADIGNKLGSELLRMGAAEILASEP